MLDRPISRNRPMRIDKILAKIEYCEPIQKELSYERERKRERQRNIDRAFLTRRK